MVSPTMSSAVIQVSDILDELSDENQRLFVELSFAAKCIGILNKFKSHLHKIHSKYDQTISSEDKQQFIELKEEFESVLQFIDNSDVQEVSDESFKSLIVKRGSSSTNYFLNKRINSLKFKKNLRNQCLIQELNEKCFDKTTKSYRCPKAKCIHSCQTKRSLKHHIFLCHRKPDILCSFPGCKKNFESTDQLKEHLNNHLNVKFFSCDKLNYDFKPFHECHLRSHPKNHSEDRPYKCISIDPNKSLSGLNANENHTKQKAIPTYVKLLNNCH